MSMAPQGFPQISAPISDGKGNITPAWLRLIMSLWDRTGGSQGTTTASLDGYGTTQGDVLYRGANQWQALPPSVSGRVLTTHGVDHDPSWGNAVASINTGALLTGGPISGTGTISVAPIAGKTVLANTTASDDVPAAVPLSDVIDTIGSTRGEILYRGATEWDVLPRGTTGQILQTGLSGSDPQWVAPASSFGNQSANLVFAGPGTGAAAPPTFRSLVGADLPNPSATTLGGVQSKTATAKQYLTSISTSGVPASAQPAASDLSNGVTGTGSVALATGPSLANVALTGTFGVFGTAPTTKPTVTGSRAGNAALASMLTGLASLGILTDSTTP